MDFYKIMTRPTPKKSLEVYADFKVNHSRDLMCRGKAFYAIWDEENNVWSKDEYDIARIVDRDILAKVSEISGGVDADVKPKLLSNFSSNAWMDYKRFISSMSDNYTQLDNKVIFRDQKVKREDYASKHLPYNLSKDDCPAFKEIINFLYDEEERLKIEWAIGSIFAGDSIDIQKFIVLYGEGGTGKSTILNIIQKLFSGYWTVFDAKALGSNSNTFSAELFKDNPLVGIQHDGDLSKIEDNTKLNSIISHEFIMINEKYKAAYPARANCMLFLGTNKPVKITDAKSGIIRRLINVTPTGNLLPFSRYNALMAQIDFELGAIANYCLDIYNQLGKHYYDKYRPIDMMEKTDVFYNFVFDNFDVFKDQDGCTLKQAYSLYKEYCDNSYMEYKLPMYRFREELKNYFRGFSNITRIDGVQVRSYYRGFCAEKFDSIIENSEDKPLALNLDHEESLLDEVLADCPAQYASEDETPLNKWSKVETTLKDINTTKLHYVMVPQNYIVIDFDLKDKDGNKSAALNLEAANKWPQTYAEYSKGGAGIHLHYIYDGDPNKLARIYSEGIEIKVFNGNASLRRRLSRCNNIGVAHINSGLPIREDKPMLNFDVVKNEKMLRFMIEKNLRKEYHAATKPSVDYIFKLLNDAYNAGVNYDVTDMRAKVLAFANNSTNNSNYCVDLVNKMKFKSEEPSEPQPSVRDDLVFFDIEVFPNLFLVNWKYEGTDRCVRMINPSPEELEELFKHKLVGFNNRRYDNHILYARYIGYSNKQLYELSQKIVNTDNKKSEYFFSEAYALSYTDVYDFASSSNKQSLKKFEIELGIHHQELGLPWDQPVPEDKWEQVAEYCDNDVIATEAVFHHLKGDWTARQILAELSGLTVNDTTNQHTTRIIFGTNKHPSLNYVDLSEEFPGYTYENGKNMYRGVDVGRGGYVYAEPGMYQDVALLDVASMHPHSILAMNCFGEYTEKFKDLMDARLLIKHEDYEGAKKIMGGKLAPYLDDPSTAKALSNALKTAINSVYGLTSAGFDNPFRDPRNKNNIVALRGALFMKTLQDEVANRGFKIAHIKTDSIKIPNASKEIIQFCMEFAEKYGYEFEHEATYEKMCLVNNAVYIAKYSEEYAPKDENGNIIDGGWTATGAQFAQPYVFKSLFSKAPLEFKDYCETKSVRTAIYIDMNEDLPDDVHNYIFVGKVGSFCPIKKGCGGGELVRVQDDKYNAVTGTKDYRWLEAEVVQALHKEDDIDKDYYVTLAQNAIRDISEYGDFDYFVSDAKGVYPWTSGDEDDLPWI